MAKVSCPGNILQNLKAEIHKCPNCGYNVEIFSDELHRKCPSCEMVVYRERIPSCIDWCPAAKECIGTEKWMELIMEERLKIKVKQLFSESVPRYYEHTLSVVARFIHTPDKKTKIGGFESYVETE